MTRCVTRLRLRGSRKMPGYARDVRCTLSGRAGDRARSARGRGPRAQHPQLRRRGNARRPAGYRMSRCCKQPWDALSGGELRMNVLRVGGRVRFDRGCRQVAGSTGSGCAWPRPYQFRPACHGPAAEPRRRGASPARTRRQRRSHPPGSTTGRTPVPHPRAHIMMWERPCLRTTACGAGRDGLRGVVSPARQPQHGGGLRGCSRAAAKWCRPPFGCRVSDCLHRRDMANPVRGSGRWPMSRGGEAAGR